MVKIVCTCILVENRHKRKSGRELFAFVSLYRGIQEQLLPNAGDNHALTQLPFKTHLSTTKTAAFISCSCLLLPHRSPLLALVGNLHSLLTVLQSHAGGVLLRSDGASLCLVLDESNTAAARDHTNLAEALEAAKDARERLLVVIVRQVLHEQNPVGRQVLVGYDGGGAGSRGLETGTTSVLCWPSVCGSTWQRTLEALCLFGCLEGPLLVCKTYVC